MLIGKSPVVVALLSALLLFSMESPAEEVLNCNIKRPGLVSEHRIAHPQYFISAVVGTPLVTYIEQGGGNWMLNTATDQRIRLPGIIDPVATPDGRFLTIPGLSFFKISDIQSGNHTQMFRDPTLDQAYQSLGLLKNTTEGGVYRALVAGAPGADGTHEAPASGAPAAWLTPRWQQETLESMRNGTAPESSESAVPAKGKFTIRDYQDKNGTLVPVGPPRGICGNLVDGEIPRISKDGRFVATKERGSTKIFEIQDDGSCRLFRDLGFMTGKVDFSPDGHRILFHTSAHSTNYSEIQTPDVDDAFMAMEMNLDSGKLRTLDLTPHGSSYYPTYMDDNKVLFLRMKPGVALAAPVLPKPAAASRPRSEYDEILGPPSTPGADEESVEMEFSLVTADLNKLAEQREVTAEASFCGYRLSGKDAHLKAAMSQIFFRHCQQAGGEEYKEAHDFRMQLGLISQMSRKSCEQLVKLESKKYGSDSDSKANIDLKYFAANGITQAPDEIDSLNFEDLLNFCKSLPNNADESQDSNKRSVVQSVPKADANRPLTPPQSCATCHGAQGSYSLARTAQEWREKPAASHSKKHDTLLDEAISRLESIEAGYTMPGAGSVEARDFLRQLKVLRSKSPN